MRGERSLLISSDKPVKTESVALDQHMRLLLSVLALGVAATSDAASPVVPTVSVAPKISDYELTYRRFALLPATDNAALGTSATYAVGEAILKVPVVLDDYAFNTGPINVPLGPSSITIPPNTHFQRVGSIKGGKSDAIAKGAPIFCSPQFVRTKERMGRLTPVQRNSFKDRFPHYVSVCFVDGDDDRKFEKQFFVYAKSGPDRALRDIAPTPYHLNRDKPLAGNSYLKLVYDAGDDPSKASIDMLLFINGQRVRYERLTFLDGKQETPARWYIPIKAAALPQRIVIGDAALSVTALNTQSKSATITLHTNLTRTSFQIEGLGSTMNIYLPVN